MTKSPNLDLELLTMSDKFDTDIVKSNFEKIDAGVLIPGNIVDNCLSDSTTLPLSAHQGTLLQNQITQLNSDILSLLDVSKAPIAPNNTDFNEVLEGTVYATTNTNDYVNLPVDVDKDGLFYTIIVSNNREYRLQIYIPSYSYPLCRYRFYSNGWTWTDWRSMVN